MKLRLLPVCFLAIIGTAPSIASAQRLSLDLELVQLPSVGSSWQTVSLINSYSAPVVVCSYSLPSFSGTPAVTRVQSVSASSFQVSVKPFNNSTTPANGPVYCVVADDGAYNSGGLKFEAHTVLSTSTNGKSASGGWNQANMEEVTSALSQSYSAPAVLGQVMSYNDSRASTFWTSNCASRSGHPLSNGRLCVSKHIGSISGSRSNETLAYIIVEGGSGSINDIFFAAAAGADSVAGTGNAPPYNYSVSADFDVGIVTQMAEDGGDGGWAVMWSSNPMPSGQLRLAIEEETVAGDSSRTHTNEQVGYWLFRNDQSASIATQKTSAISTESSYTLAIPGSDILYTIKTANTGSAPLDSHSVFVVDTLPPEIMFYNGDLDGAGPLTAAAEFIDNGSGLTFDPSTDLAFSNAATAPTSFAACSYVPVAGYDNNVRHVCFNPKGLMRGGTLSTSEFTFRLRAQVK